MAHPLMGENVAVIAAFVNGVPGDKIFAQPETWANLRERFPLELASPVVDDIDDYRKDQ